MPSWLPSWFSWKMTKSYIIKPCYDWALQNPYKLCATFVLTSYLVLCGLISNVKAFYSFLIRASSDAATQRFIEEAFSNISHIREAIKSFSSVNDVKELAEKMDLMNTKMNAVVLGLGLGLGLGLACMVAYIFANGTTAPEISASQQVDKSPGNSDVKTSASGNPTNYQPSD